MSKELRIELVLSREPNVKYTCPTCNQEHSYQVTIKEKRLQEIQAKVAHFTEEYLIPQEPEVPKKAKKKKENEQEQMQFEFEDK
ncbi:hypothetical protein [Bacillus sp. V59.32b]|uniref:hypothetical protein n=1 Tax=Bacillus sp. V59.32b TaxID=1758642 RepID=UPI000E3DB0FC|nr:hypothetical protein [Bacillus sp. V59.32b]RFU63248.1 hypothetical protein D0463_11930 [Bacillus sp. V59.32b]